MGCFRPIPAYLPPGGGRPKLWPTPAAQNTALPCGKCIGCRADHAQAWAIRATHEAQLHDVNGFWTLTYSDDNLPKDRGLRPVDLTDFWKRLRVGVLRHPHLWVGDSVRYLACGEYGSRTHRPHYHAIVFGLVPKDLYRPTPESLGTSATLEGIWGHGRIMVGTFNKGAAQYVAQYTIKQQQTERADEDGVCLHRPFLRASRRPAIGLQWLAQYANDLSEGFALADGDKYKLPRYYRTRLKADNPDLSEKIERDLKAHIATRHQPTERELQASEEIKTAYRKLTSHTQD